jgi:hypothetical protein
MTVARIKFFFMAISQNCGLALTSRLPTHRYGIALPELAKGLCDSHHVLRKRDRA